MRIAVIGSGVSGLAAALRLQAHHEVVLYESDARAGGHAHTVDVQLDGIRAPVDTGFLVYNERTYPHLIALFKELGVPAAPTDMSFAASIGPHQFEWCGSNIPALFAQPSNLFRPGFWRMLRDILRFNREATALATMDDVQARLDEPLERFLARERYSDEFRDGYLLPMAAAIWSCSTATMTQFPVGSFVRFFHNHGLLQIEGRPRWMTVPGGSREYVSRILAGLNDVRLAEPVRSIVRRTGGSGSPVTVHSSTATEHFDQVVLACHSDQALLLLADASDDERAVLGAIRYQPNRALLHTDAGLMPARRRAWAAWNYLSDGRAGAPSVSVTYWLNRLQPLPFRTPVFVSLNPLRAPRPSTLIQEFDYAHPIFDLAAGRAQRKLKAIQGRHHTWFAGAWTGYGFHEDGLRSGLEVAQALGRRAATLPQAA
ncbi:MAG: FAD-dependent oxidoreductase [Betaproteobacteria bacterium]|nr:FAD-dependent oxidoreductase [Betaproteobacteria bacterium]